MKVQIFQALPTPPSLLPTPLCPNLEFITHSTLFITHSTLSKIETFYPLHPIYYPLQHAEYYPLHLFFYPLPLPTPHFYFTHSKGFLPTPKNDFITHSTFRLPTPQILKYENPRFIQDEGTLPVTRVGSWQKWSEQVKL